MMINDDLGAFLQIPRAIGQNLHLTVQNDTTDHSTSAGSLNDRCAQVIM
jgi:hypothetical protein